MKELQLSLRLFLIMLLMVCFGSHDLHADDAYEAYVKNSKDFKPVKQDMDRLTKNWKTWVYMPWYYQWKIGFGDEGGKFCKDYGYNGGFTDWGNAKNIDFFNKNELSFYMDHTAGKGDLYIKGSNNLNWQESSAIKNRSPMINDSLVSRLHGVIKENINNVKSSPMRIAYALDDEISWGSFVKPCMWKITDDSVYRAWLKEVYGEGNAPQNPGWISYNNLRGQLASWSIGDFDCHQLMDQLTFNDSHWANFLGDLVTFANTIDPDTPVGFVGGQSPDAFGGYDYAKLMRKIQYLEAYGLDDTQTIARSFNPAIPVVSTHFHKVTADTVWQTWYSVSHGNRGFIGWVEKWFEDNGTPKAWHAEVAPHYKEVAQKIGPLVRDSKFIHDGVAIYYNQASIQMSWIMDAEAHGSTWPKRNGNHMRGSWPLVHRAWRNMLKDEGIQFNYINYVDVIQKGVPAEYKVLILPFTSCLSDVEAREIKKFVENGGTVIADFMCGIFDQHGVARKSGGVLDDIFGVKQDPSLKQNDFFTKGVWVEVDQDTNYGTAGKYKAFLETKNTSTKHESGFNQATTKLPVNTTSKYGKGHAIFLNLSPQWYNAYRQSDGMKESTKRSIFMKGIHDAGINRWVAIENATEEVFSYEVVYWEKDGKITAFLCTNPDTSKSEAGGGNSAGLKTSKVDVTLSFARPIKNVVNVRTGEKLGNGNKFKVNWTQNECVVLTFDAK